MLVWYSPRLAEDLASLYAVCFPDEGWTPEDIARVATNEVTKQAPTGARINLLKALRNERGDVIGSTLVSLHKDFVSVRRVAVRPDYRRLGWGRFLLDTVHAKPTHRQKFVARVRETNPAAAHLFRSAGFRMNPYLKDREKDEHGIDYYQFSLLKLCNNAGDPSWG